MRPILVIVTAPFLASPALAQLDLSWFTHDCGGGTSTGLSLQILAVIGQHDAATLTGGSLQLRGGFLPGGSSPPCYANCDGSTGSPTLTANDFQCFINAYAANQPYANCDGSTGNPLLTANDFQCFINAYAAGCAQ